MQERCSVFCYEQSSCAYYMTYSSGLRADFKQADLFKIKWCGVTMKQREGMKVWMKASHQG